jgi:hypothetical protein
MDRFNIVEGVPGTGIPRLVAVPDEDADDVSGRQPAFASFF